MMERGLLTNEVNMEDDPDYWFRQAMDWEGKYQLLESIQGRIFWRDVWLMVVLFFLGVLVGVLLMGGQ